MTTDISKLKVAPESKFFTEINGKIYFRETEEHAFILHINEFHKSYKQLISAVACYEWYKYFNNEMNKNCMDTDLDLTLEAINQIKLWESLGEGEG
jgi:hypothetical protein